MKVLVRVIAAAAMVATSNAMAEPGSCLAMPDAITEALSFDPRIDAAVADRDSARANVRAAYSRNLPQVSLFGRTGRGDDPRLAPSDRDQLGLQASQEIYSFGARRFATDAARARAEAAKFSVEDTRNNIAQGAALAFLDLQRAERLLFIAKEQEAALARDAETAASRLSRQVITLTDASQIKARLSVARSARINAEVDVETARVRLSVLTNQDFACLDGASTEPFVGKDAGWLLGMDLNAAVDEAFARSATMREARAQLSSAQAGLGEAQRANLPVVSGFALQTYYYDRAFTENPLFPDANRVEDDTRLGLTLNQQIFSGGRNAARRDDARARLRRARSDVALQRVIVEDLVKRSLAQARAQQKAGLELLNAAEQAQIQLDNTLTEYNRSTKTLTDLTLAYDTYYRTLQDETNARFAFYSSLVRVYAAMGTLTDGVDR